MNKKILGGLVAAGLALTACSDDDDGADDTSTTEAAATSGPPADLSSTETTDATEAEDTTEDTDAASTTTAASAGNAVLDSAFGDGGVAPVGLSTTDHDRFITIVEGPDGLFYTSGFTSAGDDHSFAIARFKADGTPDETFGDAGHVAVNVVEGPGGGEVGRGLVVQDDGKIVVAGPTDVDPDAAGDAADDLDIAAIRLHPDGTLDDTFGEAGIARIDLGVGRTIDPETYITDNAWGLTAGGYAIFGVTPNQAADRTDTDYAVIGLTDTGALDPTFGTDGVVIADVDASGDSARNIGTQADGKILATGYSRDGDGIVSPVLIRMSPQGVLDETFGTGGIANNIVLPGVTESYQWATQGDSYVLAGYGRGADSEEKVDLVAYRFGPDGAWDQTFGTDGVTRVDLVGEDDRARNLTILPDGSILIVGSGKLDADDVDAMIVKLDADGAPVEAFGDGGHVLIDLGGPSDAFYGVTVTKDGSAAVVAGYKGADPEGTENDDAVLARLPL